MYGNGPRMSGANQTPLGAFGVPGIRKPAPSAPSASESLLNPSYLQSFKSGGLSTSDFPWPGAPPPPPLSSSSDIGKRPAAFDGPDLNGGERKRKKRSRWADEDSKANVPMPTVLPPGLTKEQEEAFLLQLQIEEITRRLRTGDLGIPANPEERSPSPEPIYNHEGKRMNTREYRTRKKLEEERHKDIVRMSELNKDYKPPMDYKPPIIKISDKVMIPQDENPGINFVGLLIGPRGNTLKAMEKETGAKIIIRGKGSVKEGKVGRKDGQPLPGEDEPLHAYVTSSSAESVKKAVEKIKEVIRQGIEVPEGQNDLRRMQLRELALLNGTLRELDIPRCNNCGATSHKSWECPDKPNVTANVICSACGGGGHIARDCRQRRIGPPGEPDQSKIDEEYSALMAELGEAPPKPPGTGGPGGSRFGAPQQVGGYGYGRGGYTQRPRPPGPGGYGQMGQQPAPPGAGVSQWGVPPPGVPPPGVPPPGMGYGAPQGGQWGAPQMQGYGQMSQYAGFMQPPPPPPPVSGANGQSGGHGALDSQAAMNQWGMQGMQGMQAMQGWGMPPPVPPPSWGQPQTGQGTGQMGYMGVPPPPPASKMSSASRIDLNALAQAGLPNLLAAPPPPPPPPQ